MDELSQEESLLNRFRKYLGKKRFSKKDFSTKKYKDQINAIGGRVINDDKIDESLSVSKYIPLTNDECILVLQAINETNEFSDDLECDDMDELLKKGPMYYQIKVQEGNELSECEKFVALYFILASVLKENQIIRQLGNEEQIEKYDNMIAKLDIDTIQLKNINKGHQAFKIILGLDQDLKDLASFIHKYFKGNDMSLYISLLYGDSELKSKIDNWKNYCRIVNQARTYRTTRYPRWADNTIENDIVIGNLKEQSEDFNMPELKILANILGVPLNQYEKLKATYLLDLEVPFIDTFAKAQAITKWSSFSK